MRVVGFSFQWRRLLRVVPLAAMGMLVAACSSNLLSGRLPDWFARSNTPANQAPGQPQVRELDEECPGVDIRTGAGTLSVAAKSQEPTASDLRYQLTFTQLARQCFAEAGTVRMR